MKQFCIVASVLLSLVAGITVTHADVLPYGMKIEKVLDLAAEPADLAQSPRGELWLLERTTGTLRVFRAGAEAASLVIAVSNDCDSGLLSVAFAPDHVNSGKAFVYYVDPTGVARVDEVIRSTGGLALGGPILSLGTTILGCRPGGGMEVGPDGKLYVAVGDLENPQDAQNNTARAGKVLRANLDGSVPVDNPSGTLVWATGFRDGSDLTINRGGGVYVTDSGEAAVVSDEVNAVQAGGNYGWDITHGDSGGVYADPLVADLPVAGARSLVALKTTGLGDPMQDSVVYACDEADEMRRLTLTGGGLDLLDEQSLLFDPDGDRDGFPDAGCPKVFNTIAEGADGNLYGANSGDNPGVWRIWRDLPGPREVSAPGTPFPLMLEKQGLDILFSWENLGDLDIGRPKRHNNQPDMDYTIWEGTLPIDGSYDHVKLQATNGTPDGPARKTQIASPGTGSRYYLVGAQADNLEKSMGTATDGTPRTATTDHCDGIGYGIFAGSCAQVWVDVRDGSELKLTDYNPNSPTYMQKLGMSDFRGRVVKIDISADNCVYCNLMANVHPSVDVQYGRRDLSIVTVLTLSFQGLIPIAPSNCASVISAWAGSHGEETPVLCDVDYSGDNVGDVSQQYWDGPGCGGTPQNIYVGQGHYIYARVCGGQLSYDEIHNMVKAEVNPETCE